MRAALVLMMVLAAGCGGDNPQNNDLAVADLTPPADLTRVGVGDAAGGCDPILQNCTDATNSKCAMVSMAGMVVNECVAPMGNKAQGQTCTRATPGLDDCDKGLYCAALALVTRPPTRTCLGYCANDGDCGAGSNNFCAALPGVIEIGVCVPSCTLFGTSCGATNTCGVPISGLGTNFFSCHGVGTNAIGAACNAGFDCPADSACIDPAMTGATTCFQLCNSAHACATGTCKPLNAGSSDGYCQ
jgi:hypothetical protein